jgi:hypothetical protein
MDPAPARSPAPPRQQIYRARDHKRIV